MTEPEAPSAPEAVTAWHPMLVAALETYLPSGWQLIAELLLSRLPQRVDIVILELVGTAPGAARKLLSIFDFLRPHNLIEFKGPTDDLAAEDALVLLAYGAQYMRLKKLKDPSEICLMVIADRIPPAFVEQIERLQGRFTPTDKGLWQGEVAGAVLHGVETGMASQRGSTEQLLYVFSRAFLKDPRGGLPLDEEARKVYILLQNQVEQFRKLRGETAMKDYELAKISLEELLQPVMQEFTPEQIARTFPAEKLAKALTPEQLAKALTPEQLAKALTPEQLTEFLAALPPELREQIKRQLH
ncbi:MAG: hypothetical protein L6Q76_20725 [Polyangiaceae bacterium]|nr:hypothetical protein [Polyangiaceae bacterium]